MPKLRTPLKPHQIAIIAAGLASLILWAIPGIHFLMLPLEYLNTHIHELCHAIVCVATGGEVQRIEVHAAGDGVTPIIGGNLILEGSAGYVGATIVGAFVMFCGRTEKSARFTLRILAIVMTVGMLLWLRADAVGVISGILWVGTLFLVSKYVKGSTLLFATQFVGLQQCLNSVQSLYVLLQLSAFTEAHSDAKLLEGATKVPSIVWALGWCAFSLAMVVLGLRRAWSIHPRNQATPSPV